MTIVFPKWVTKVGATLIGFGGFVELFQGQVFPLLTNAGIAIPQTITVGAIVLGGVLGVLGKALGDTDGDGIPDGFQKRA